MLLSPSIYLNVLFFYFIFYHRSLFNTASRLIVFQRRNKCVNIWTPVRDFYFFLEFFLSVEHANARTASCTCMSPQLFSKRLGALWLQWVWWWLPPGLFADFPLWLVPPTANKGTSFNSPSLLSTRPTYLLFPDLTLPTICSAYRHKVGLLMLLRWERVAHLHHWSAPY